MGLGLGWSIPQIILLDQSKIYHYNIIIMEAIKGMHIDYGTAYSSADRGIFKPHPCLYYQITVGLLCVIK